MNSQTKELPALKSLPLVENPAALRITTFSPKAWEQLRKLGGESYSKPEIPWDDLEVVGIVQEYALLVRIVSTGHLAQLHSTHFLIWMTEKNGWSNEEANAKLHSFPQVFTV